MIFEENLQYESDFLHVEELPLEWKIILKWIGGGKEVLEVGCHAGNITAWIQRQHNKITGIELNAVALQRARSFLENDFQGDIESDNTWSFLSGKKFDVVLFGHVLEHLQDPWKVLNKTKDILSEDGILIVALPNISNADSRFKIFFGRFEYEQIGVMDRTHLRFFNVKTAREMILNSGFKIEEYVAPVQLNPLREFIDHLPVLTRLRSLFSKKPPRFPKFSSNLTDVVMLFKCRLK